MIRVTAFVLLTAASTSSFADEWKDLWDGETMAGWKINENDDSWKIEDGALRCQGDRSHLFYVGDEKPFKDFELKNCVLI